MPRLSILTPAQARAIGLIGTAVTLGDNQYTVHSIEGGNWYAHLASDGMVVVDQGLSGGNWVTEPFATLIPSNRTIGDGWSRTAPMARLRQGVSLVKAYA